MRELTKKNHWYKAIFPLRKIPIGNRSRRVACKTASNSPKNKFPMPSFRITTPNYTETDQLIHKKYPVKWKNDQNNRKLRETWREEAIFSAVSMGRWSKPIFDCSQFSSFYGKIVNRDWNRRGPGMMNFIGRRKSNKENHRLDWIPNRACFRTEYAEVENWRRSLWRWRHTWRVLARIKFHT